MNRHTLVLAASVVLVNACAGGPSSITPAPTGTPAASALATSTPLPTQTETPSPTPLKTATSTSAPSPTPTVSLEPWPEGIAAYPAGGSHELGYIEYLPPGYGAGVAPSPLLVYLHETGQDGTGTEAELHKLLRYGIPRMIADGTWPAEQPFVILTPQYRSADANTRCEVGDYLDEFINFASKAYHIDVTRIYLTGFSCGGIGVWDYFAENGDSQVAAAVSVAGHPMYALQKVGCDFARAPLWVLHGADDDLIPADFLEGKIDDLRSCVGAPSSELKLTILPDAGHEIFQAYDGSAGYDIYSWLLDHKLGK